MTTSVNNATEQDNAIQQVVTITDRAINAQVPSHLAGMHPVDYFKAVFQHDTAHGHKQNLWRLVQSAIGNELSGLSAQEQQEMLELYALLSGAIDKMRFLTFTADSQYRNIEAIASIPAGSLWVYHNNCFVLSDSDQHRTLPADEWAEAFHPDTL